MADTKKRMRLAVTAAENAGPMAPILLRGDLATAARDAKAIGYEAIEVHVPDIWQFDADKFAADCRTAGVGVSALVSGQLFVRKGLNLSDDDPAVIAKAIEGLKLFVDASAKAETGVVVGWVRGRAGDRDKKTILSRQADAIRDVALYGQDKNVPIYIEVINRYEVDTLTTTDDTLDFIESNQLPNTYVHLDTYHMNIDEYSPARAIRKCGPLLGYFHLAENTRFYPGHDRLNFDEVFAALEQYGYTGYASVECLPLPTGPEAARRAFEFLRYRYF